MWAGSLNVGLGSQKASYENSEGNIMAIMKKYFVQL